MYDKSSAPALTQQQVLDRRAAVAAHYGTMRNRKFVAIPDIEGTKEDAFAAMAVAGTILQPAADALTAQGIATGGTMGGLMRELGLGQEAMHALACECHGSEVAGATMEHRFNNLKQ
jgi:cysteine synthase